MLQFHSQYFHEIVSFASNTFFTKLRFFSTW